jgi:uncharacterized protein (DUF1810 family)
MDDSFDLERFVTAQAPVIETVTQELRSGEKRSHWIWFVFPQLRGLGKSSAAHHYGIPSIRAAKAYLAHPVLGPRLDECTALVCAVEDRTAEQIFGPLDSLKFRSSMTLFAAAQEGESTFRAALVKYYAGEADPLTLKLLADSAYRSLSRSRMPAAS